MTPEIAKRRYHVGYFGAMALYVILVLAAVILIRHVGVVGPVLYVIAASPSVPLIYSIFVVARYISEIDEYQRAMQVRRMLAGLGATLAVCSFWGFLEVFANAPRLDLYLVYPMFCAFWGLSCIFIRTAK